MASLSDLPEILTRVDFAALAGRDGRSIELMAARGLVAAPTHRHQGHAAWEASAVTGWFRKLQAHAVIVPAHKAELADLRDHGVYMCPLDGRHVGLARPKLLITYEPGGHGRVFDVTAVETVNQPLPGTRPAVADTLDLVAARHAPGQPPSPWTVFHLTPAGTVHSITPLVRQARYLPLPTARRATRSPTLTLPTLDAAFPPQA